MNNFLYHQLPSNLNRRGFIKTAAFSLGSLYFSSTAFARASKPPLGHVVIIGGGYAGLTAAKYLRLWSLNNIAVTVIEQSAQFVSCPVSNLVLGGSKSMNDITFGYDLAIKNHDLNWVHDTVTAIDTKNKKLTLQRGQVNYDRLIIAPGVDFDYASLPMLQSGDAQQQVPHAWKAGKQTVDLRRQLEAMADGDTFVISIPKVPYRCPPGPYERVCQVADYFKKNKPRSKIIVLDGNAEIISKKALFTKAWAELYAGMIDYRPNNVALAVDVNSKTITTEFENIKADVLNVIPPQRAGQAAQMAGLLEPDYPWCEVDFLTYESKRLANVHVIGDSVAAGLPKSAHMATSQARVCASAIVALMSGEAPDPAPVFANTCYSFVNESQAIHVANVYRYDAAKKIMVAAPGGGVSAKASLEEGQYAQGWALNIWSDVLT